MRILIPALLMMGFGVHTLQAQENQWPVKVVTGHLIRVTPKLSDLNPDPNAPNFNDVVRDNYGLISMRGVARENTPPYNDPTAQPKGADPALQPLPGTARGTDGATDNARTTGVEVVQQFDGMGYTNVSPADPTLCVGPNHIIQMINGSSGSYFRIFSKTGAALSAQTYLDQLTGAGFFGQGDPIALYDGLANRYVLCEFGNITGSGNPTHLIMCVSQTADPTGAWHIYRFATPGIFPDYPHWGVWNNAYYATTNDFNTAGTAFLGCSMFAFDRTKMLAGDASATVQISTGAYGVPFNTASNRSLAPVGHMPGSPAPAAGSPGLFSYYNEDALTAAADVDSVGFFTFLPDFTNPANTVIGRLPAIPVAPFKANVCASRNCASGCNGSSGYDVLSDRLMHHSWYRRFGTYDVITMQHTVDAGGVRPAARWYELRNTGSGWTVHQQSTFSPDASHRFMPSMAMNAAGQICLGYNITGGNACGSIAFTGRNAADPINTMTYDEAGGTCGTGYGTFGNRWGDYNDMNADPGAGQDSIFWFTAMYGQANWNTRILKIKLTPNAQFDARTEWVNMNAPGAISALTCAPTAAQSSDLCNNQVTPYVLVRNKGLGALTSVVIKYQDGAYTETRPVTGLNIPVNGTQQFILTPYTATPGPHNVLAWTEQPNNQPDGNNANDTARTSFNILVPPSLPVAYGFVPTTPFLPAGWSLFNPNNNQTWDRFANGNGGANGSARFRNWTPNNSNQIDDIRTVPISTAGMVAGDSIIISFDVAHRYFGTSGTSWDTLTVLSSADCGATFAPTGYKKWGAALATEGISTTEYTTPTVWRRERVAIGGAALSGSNFVVAWRNTSRFGNNIYIDNINIEKKLSRDMLVSAIINPAGSVCSGTITPQATVRNNGTETVTSYQLSYFVNGGAPVTISITGASLAAGTSATHTFAPVTLPPGNHNICITVSNITTTGGTGDQNPANDQVCTNFVVRTLFTAPITEGFEATAFVPANWALNNPNNNNTWVRRTPGKQSSFSAFIDNYNFNLTGQIDDIVSLPVNMANADSLVLSFDLAHKNFAGFNDTLKIMGSANCGTSFFTTTYSKGGAGLATAGSSTANYTNPIDSDWRRETMSIPGTQFPGGNAIVAFRMVNGYGNNVFVDNINIRLKYRRDLAMSQVIRPVQECAPNFTPSVRVSNEGSDIITGVTVVYSIDNGTPVSTTLTGLNITPGTSSTLTLTGASGINPGTHSFRVYSTSLVTNGGTGDQNVSNDTLSRNFTVYTTVQAPLVEKFENATFPPANWGVNNADLGTTWTRNTLGFAGSNGSAFMRNYTYGNANGTVDELVSPMIAYTGVDSVFLAFDLAASTRNYPGSTVRPMDTLEVLISRDCGNTATTIWKKWGADLQTINDPNYPFASEFSPTNDAHWKRVRLNITQFAGLNSNNVQVIIRNKSNTENNIYIDNINFSTLKHPEGLKRNGYIIYPSPFTTQFFVQHLLPPTDLRYVDVFDARGRLVLSKRFGNGGTSSLFSVNMEPMAAGTYTIKLGYTNKQIVQKIVKTN